MNKERRELIQSAIETIRNTMSDLEQARDDEQNAFDNLTEGLQQTERGQTWESNAATIGEAIDNIDYALSDLEGVL